MKNLLIILTLALSINVSGLQVLPQSNEKATEKLSSEPSFLFLRGHKQGQFDYALQWSMTSNIGIDHFEIQSTYEDPYDPYSNWANEGTAIITNANIIKFTDKAVMPGIIGYRVVAVSSNGLADVVSGIHVTTIQ